MKILVIAAHPNLEKSRVNRRWLEELRLYPEITVHQLYEAYPDEKIDVKREQSLLIAHDRIVFQFPFYWYSSPPLLKKWHDVVLEFGWAYGPGGTQLHGKEYVLAISAGGPEEAYQPGGYNQYSIGELTRPFQATSNLIGTAFLKTFRIHRARSIDEQAIDASAKAYVAHILDPKLNRNKKN